MATLISALIADARVDLKETTARFWTDAELLAHFKKGVNDLWGAIVDLNEAHYQTTDITNVSLTANSETLTGIPSDCFRVKLIEPRDLTNDTQTANVMFWPRKSHSAAARNARQLNAQDPSGGLDLFYEVEGPGAPVATPTVRIAPQVTAVILLRLIYIAAPGSAALTTASNNPIPGESDNAMKAWMVAHARAKEREDRSPDPNWLAIYGTEKQNLLVRMAPRQQQEPDVVEDLFGGYI